MSLLSAFIVNVFAAIFNIIIYKETKFELCLVLATITASFALVLLLVMVIP